MITLYGSPYTRSFRALWALEEAGLSYEYRKINIGSHEENGSQTSEYKAINSQGKVPTLVDGDLVITESAAIVNYIAALAPQKKLIPLDDAVLRAKYDDICFFVLSDLEQPLWTYSKHRFILPENLRLPVINETVKYEFAKSLAALQEHLGDNSFAINNQFSMADILIAHTLQWARSAKFKVPRTLSDYANLIYQRSACQRALLKA